MCGMLVISFLFGEMQLCYRYVVFIQSYFYVICMYSILKYQQTLSIITFVREEKGKAFSQCALSVVYLMLHYCIQTLYTFPDF